MNWSQTYERLQAMAGMQLRSIKGKTDILLESIDRNSLSVVAGNGTKSRPTSELQRIVQRMDYQTPVHVDSVLYGSGSSRSHPETILANMPDVEFLYIDGRKHIVWMGQQTHGIGTLKEVDAFTASQIRDHYAGRGPISGRVSTAIAVVANNVRDANTFLAELLQGPAPRPLHGGKAYSVSTESADALLVVDSKSDSNGFRVFPLIKVNHVGETVRRIQSLYPNAETEEIDAGEPITVVNLPGGSSIALK